MPFGLGVVRPPPGWPSEGSRTTPSCPQSGSAAPWAKQKFERLAQRATEPPPRPLGVVRSPQTSRLNHPQWPRGSSATPKQADLGWPNHPRANGVANHHLWGGSATPAYIYLKKKCVGGILGINRLNELNCHNLKV
jgi:hypothetical protein